MSQVALASSTRRPKLLRAGLAKLSDLQDYAYPVPDLFVDGKTGADSRSGLSWDDALDTMGAALAKVQTGGRIFFRGDIREELTGSNLKFDVTIIGAGGLHHPDEPSSAYHPGSSTWRPPSSPTAATPLLKLRGRGWTFINIFFDCPVDAAAVYLERNASSGTDEYDPSHASFINCRFVDGKYGIEDNGGCYNITVEGCEFKAMTTAAIANTSTSVANPLNWKIRNCLFPSDTSDFGNATHIDSPLNSSHILDSVFGTVRSTAKYIDLTGGNNNVVTRNLLAGEYNTNDYVAGTGDVWAGNQSISASFGGNSAQGTTLAAPAAAT
jgi:hypothetical protein